MQCTNCHAALEPGEMFCGGCGSPVTAQPATPPPATPPPATPPPAPPFQG